MKKSKVFQFFYILILIIFIFFSTMLMIRLGELHRGNNFYKQIRKEEKLISTTSSGFSLSVRSVTQPFVSKGQQDEYISPEIHKLSSQLSKFAEKYSDAVIWLQLPDTILDYPVMFGKDNQFYLNHLPDKSKNALGSLFLDYRTNEDSVHLIIYGHNGTGGKMFGLLKKYESQNYFLKHKKLIVATPDSIHVCPIFSVRWVEADSDAYEMEFENRDSLINYINQAATESLYQIDVDLEDGARVLTLSTCTDWKRSQRFIVQALLPPV